ncbi:MAG TPA: type II toxin-antitoxin system VapC family toxin [Candidatus Sulfotelmatobacter sp.]|nr:type II toxin-antitoxin system VapC family toxin [Candidatus Sulfotelmatobacter sp.]
MTRVVVDASVAVKWCLPAQREEFVTQAEELLASCRRNEIRFLVPDLFWVELANALWKAIRRGEISPDSAASAVALVRDLGIVTAPSLDLVPEALNLAVTHGCTVYDSLYVALAMESKSELITADERLANALAARFPVKWLGAF